MEPNPVDLSRRLVRYNTANPPGNELECANYLKTLLERGGLSVEILGPSPHRPNLIARLPGLGRAAPLLLQGHMDVVPASGDGWQHPPFEGVIEDGWLWGRGALDMKTGIAMMVCALLRAKSEGTPPPGDVILALVSDEETGGSSGARYLVERHPERIAGVQYAIGEFGGFTSYLGGRPFHPIMVAEKQVCRLQATVRGTGGHGALYHQDNPTGEMGRFLHQLQARNLPVHLTQVTRMMFQAIGNRLPFPAGIGATALLRPPLTPWALKLMGAQGRSLNPLFRNTVNATVVRGGDQINVSPREVTAMLDGRVLPGLDSDCLLAELRPITGPAVEMEVTHFEPGPETPDMGLYPALADVLREEGFSGAPVPMLMPASTDGRHFAKLGIQTYGFLPMELPPGFDFASTVHGVNERIPVPAIESGSRAIYRLLQRFDQG